MKIQCNRTEFYNSWAVTQGAVPTRPTRPILANIKITAADEKVELQATDMDVGIKMNVEGAKVLEDGSAVIPAALFGSILRDSRAENVELLTEELLIHITLQNSRFKIHGDDPEHFPELPEFDEKKLFDIPKSSFLEMVHLTSFATAREDTRYALNGVLMTIKGKDATMVATDGRRLSYARCKIPAAVDGELSAIIPSRGLQEIERALQEGDDAVRIAIEGNRLFARGKSAVTFTKLVEGAFPNFEEVIPKDNDKKVTARREELLADLRQAAKMTSEDSRAVTMFFEKGKLTLKSSSQEAGDAVIESEVQYDGDPFDIRFNPLFLTDVLKVVGAEEISMEFKEKTSPGVLRAGNDFAYVIMPINIE